MKLNLAECFFQKAEQQADHPLILGPGAEDRTSYSEFREEIRLLAKRLRDAGVGRGSNIGLHYRGGRDYIAFVYAIWNCGACVTPLPLELTVPEKRQIFQHIHMDGVISGANILDQIRASVRPAILSLTRQAVFAKVDTVCEAPSHLADINPAFIRFTSGTTGDAKGVVLSHRSIYERIHAANQVLQISENDRILWLLSMDYHFAVSIVAYLMFGAGIILPKNSFGVTLLTAASDHRATFIYGSPIHYSLMTQDDTGALLPPELRLAIVTTTALRSEIADAFYKRFGRILNETYGIIELGLPAINVSHLKEKQGSVGRMVPGYELRLDCLQGQEQGEITIRGKGVLDAYYFPWQSRDAILRQNDGWFRTGDIGRLDADGFLYIVGRIKEMISIGGLKFFPEEVESVLENHPAIHAACVFAVQERQWGMSAMAYLVLAEGRATPDDNELIAYCKKYLTRHKIPGRFQWVDHLTYTASGKKNRNPEK
ncbi:class I adenylate-forming enzyme family protein [Desulfonema magnum]|uniref:AMP-dependent synthetase/ligase family protein n=1 Tax=Desulfonema magnum TaxID=45655 RepID=A0A975BIS3_9BACT|nr:class I adenylate-forming enzyme family protein [Desulfonema magnum]QTA86287.1 AMP-dependent synthetase/ligase family protein [Desulfonema magnum]